MVWNNGPLIASLFAWVISQTLKFIIELSLHRRLDFTRLVNPGGMPSSHSCLVSCLSISIGRATGWESPLFAVATVLSLIVLYDAAGIRRAAGKQARVVNKIVDELYTKHEFQEERLKELLGHTPLEVIAGVLLGAVVALEWPLG